MGFLFTLFNKKHKNSDNLNKKEPSIIKKVSPPDVKKMRKKHDVRGLIKALVYEKENGVWLHAAEGLGEIGDSRAVQPLLEIISDDNVILRCEAIQALGEIRNSKAIFPLVDLTMDEDADVRLNAVAALGKIGGMEAVSALIAALKDDDWQVPITAAKYLGKIGDEYAVNPLIHALAHNSEGVRLEARRSLDMIYRRNNIVH